MNKKKNKFDNAAHIRKHTVGTSNEISFSVLEAAKNKLEGESGKDSQILSSRPGIISLFTLPLRRKKSVSTPAKEQGLHLSNGEFVSSEDSASRASHAFEEDPLFKRDPSSCMKSSAHVTSEKTTISNNKKITSPASCLSPEEEVHRRKKRRRRQRITVAALVALIGLATIGVGAGYLYQENEKHRTQVNELFSALDLIKQADATVLEMDRLVANPHDAASIARSTEVLNGMESARKNLAEADRIVREASADLRESKDKEAANQAVLAVKARNALLENGEFIILEAQRASTAVSRLQAAWQEVIAADMLAREAAALVIETTDESVTASKEKSTQAIETFSVAQSALDELSNEFPQIDIAQQKSYVTKRLESMGYAIASDDAFLEKNKEEAIKQNDAYNTADAEAVEIAAGFPSDITQPVYGAFDQAIEKAADTYSTARLQAGSADAFLSDYLGTTSK